MSLEKWIRNLKANKATMTSIPCQKQYPQIKFKCKNSLYLGSKFLFYTSGSKENSK